MADRLDNTRDAGQRAGFSLVESVVVLLAVVSLVAIIQPSLASARRQSKYSVCLDRLAVIAEATAIYSEEDPADMALPVHPLQYEQDPSNPSHIGAYEWGGKAGKGQPSWTPGSGGILFFLTSRYGTKAGFDPASRPLNRILYPHGFADHGIGLPYDRDGAILDTQLQLDAFRCPSDDGPPAGGHCIDWTENPDLTAYDYFGTSYHANVFMTSSVVSPMVSISPYLGSVRRVPNPARTLAYNEAIGRWAWAVKRNHSACAWVIGSEGVDPGPTKTVRGWHGKNWTFNRSFVDGHVSTQKVLIEGTRDSNGYFEHYREELVFPDDPQNSKIWSA